VLFFCSEGGGLIVLLDGGAGGQARRLG
jgi:hypothetical protein